MKHPYVRYTPDYGLQQLRMIQPDLRCFVGTDLTNRTKKPEWNWLARSSCLAAAGMLAVACASPQPKVALPGQKSKEYFSEKDYGVKASPRVSIKRSRLRRGGGRNQVGKPYKVKGKWYYPKDVRSYSKVGKASWYGSAFHGRLTANGEIYDMTHLTAAHPTLPLPSYARVTNLANGSSVIVRINDRGPFAHGRVIDLSKRAAEMLDYTHAGVAKVKVDYIGRAPLHGRDDSYLLASYRGDGASRPSDGLPTGVMIALDGSTPERRSKNTPKFLNSGRKLPEAGPILPDRPVTGLLAGLETRIRVLSYAGDIDKPDASAALESFVQNHMSSADIVASWKRQRTSAGAEALFAGTFTDSNRANDLAALLSRFGKTELERTETGSAKWTSLYVYPNDGVSLNKALEFAWDSGASDAMILRDQTDQN